MHQYLSTEHVMTADYATSRPSLSFSGTPAEFYLNFGQPIYP
ncbi:hypothetical protein [Glutamicibacter sp. NPDC087344]